MEQAGTAYVHVEKLARAAKRAGHPGRIGPLRADIHLSLLEGRRFRRTAPVLATCGRRQARVPLAEPGYRVRLVALLQGLDLRVVQTQVNSGDGVGEMVVLRRSHDGRVNPGLAQ